MTQALIQINAVSGSNTNLPINTLVQLNNLGNGGETTWLWAILDQPTGAADALSNVALQNPTFTPRKEGTYLIQVIVNQALASEQRNQVVASVVYLKSLLRNPAAGESTEASATLGWKGAQTTINEAVSNLKADTGVQVGTLFANATQFDVFRPENIQAIKVGLPGAENLTQWRSILATAAEVTHMPLSVVLASPLGSLLANGLAQFRVFGLLQSVPLVGAVVGDIVFVSDLGTLDRAAGTNSRRVGRVVTVPSVNVAHIWFNGLGGN